MAWMQLQFVRRFCVNCLTGAWIHWPVFLVRQLRSLVFRRSIIAVAKYLSTGLVYRHFLYIVWIVIGLRLSLGHCWQINELHVRKTKEDRRAEVCVCKTPLWLPLPLSPWLMWQNQRSLIFEEEHILLTYGDTLCMRHPIGIEKQLRRWSWLSSLAVSPWRHGSPLLTATIKWEISRCPEAVWSMLNLWWVWVMVFFELLSLIHVMIMITVRLNGSLHSDAEFSDGP